MGTRSTQEQDRIAAVNAAVRDWLAAGDTRAALHAARHELERQAAVVRRTDPARGMLADAGLAGSLLAIAAALPDHQPRKPRGYASGPPGADHLLAAFGAAYTETVAR